MTPFLDNLDSFNDFTKQGLEPARNVAGAYVDAVEKIARQNYALAGDMIDFALQQSRLPLEATDPKALFERQIETGKAFAEQLTARANEYVELGNDVKEATLSVIDQDIVEPAKAAARAATEQAA